MSKLKDKQTKKKLKSLKLLLLRTKLFLDRCEWMIDQVGSALQWIHSKNLCHLDVKLENILVFRSDFSLVKLCDFGSVKPSGDIVIKKNELLPYCPAELVAKHANEWYQVDRVQDVFQFGIVVFFCLQGVLPWQKVDIDISHI